jgi:methane monooxygenase component C
VPPAEHQIQLSFEGQPFASIACREDEDVITAALRQNLLLLSDCRAGTCGTCRARVEDGEPVDLLEHSPHALSERDAEEGWVLCCRLRPASDLALDFDYPSDRIARFEAGLRRGVVVGIERCNTNVMRLVVRTLAAQEPLSWQPGQYMRLQFGESGPARAYSMANLPSAARELEFFIKLLPDGQFSRALDGLPGPGGAISLQGPFGNFKLQPGDSAPVFVAGGTGLAPILALLRELAESRPQTSAALIFGVASESGLFASSELAQLRARLPNLETICVWDPQATAVDALARYLSPRADAAVRSYYLCGPAAMLASARELLHSLGVPASSVHQEAFIPSDIILQPEEAT